MTWALSFFIAGVGVIGIIGIKRRPRFWVALGFGVLLMILFGLLSLGLTGSWLELVYRPLIKVVGLYPLSQDSLWRISMMLSVLVPPGFIITSVIGRKIGILAGVVGFVVYSLVVDILIHLLIRLI